MKRILTLALVPFLLLSCGDDEDSNPGSNPDNITFLAAPPTEIDHNRIFQFTARATHSSGDPVILEIASVPSWLTKIDELAQISGTPDWARLNTAFVINIMATNGVDTAYQRSEVRVSVGDILCGSGFGNPENSRYILPFKPGKTFNLQNGNCPTNPTWGHQKTFAYDFGTPMGTDIIAMRGGTVISAISLHPDIPDCSVGGGNIVFIEHDDGSVAFYGHFMQNSVKVNVGDIVEQGDLLAQSGNSGCSAGPHVHVQVYRQRGPYDREYSLPINFRNANGPMDSNRSLVIGQNYSAN